MARIEKGLHGHHAEAAAYTHPPARQATVSQAQPTPIVEAPFARVNSVTPGSPADTAGLKVGDCIKRFGSVGALNHEKLAKVASEVQQNEDVWQSKIELSGII